MAIGAVCLLEMIVDFILERFFCIHVPIRISKYILAGISIVLVGISYFTVVAATAIIFKITGRRLLPDFRRKNAATYWTKREETAPTLDYLKRQF
jgi:hypothetical protein